MSPAPSPLCRRARRLVLLLAVAAIPFPRARAERPSPSAQNAVLIGWDGTRREDLKKLLAEGSLPNLAQLIKEGGLVDTDVTTGATETKPGWAEILTGRNADGMGIESNTAYRPIPKGFTVFEIAKRRLGKGVATIFLTGKLNNLGSRGPHRICLNCLMRQEPDFAKTFWWDEALISSGTLTLCGLPRRWAPRVGEPYLNALDSIDVYRNGLGPADKVGAEALAALDGHADRRFLAFLHFEEPDEQGHLYSEGSRQYVEAIRQADLWLGRIVAKLKALGVYGRTAVFVTTDHGFDPDRGSHNCAPETFLAANQKVASRGGDRKDVAPTLLESFGIDPAGISPPLEGRSLLLPQGRR